MEYTDTHGTLGGVWWLAVVYDLFLIEWVMMGKIRRYQFSLIRMILRQQGYP